MSEIFTDHNHQYTQQSGKIQYKMQLMLMHQVNNVLDLGGQMDSMTNDILLNRIE